MKTRTIQLRVVEFDSETGERTELRCWNVTRDARKHQWIGGRADGNSPTYKARTLRALLNDMAPDVYLAHDQGASK